MTCPAVKCHTKKPRPRTYCNRKDSSTYISSEFDVIIIPSALAYSHDSHVETSHKFSVKMLG